MDVMPSRTRKRLRTPRVHNYVILRRSSEIHLTSTQLFSEYITKLQYRLVGFSSPSAFWQEAELTAPPFSRLVMTYLLYACKNMLCTGQ